MAGYIVNMKGLPKEEIEFHIGDENLSARLFAANSSQRVMTLQLDGDELEAALWGLNNYKKDLDGKQHH